MAGLGRDTVPGAGDSHVGRLKGGVLCGRERVVRRESRHLRVWQLTQITEHQGAHLIELLLRCPMSLNVAACQQPSERKWSVPPAFLRNSAAEQLVALTSRPSRPSAFRRAGVRSARPTSPTTITSMSLVACSSPRATEP